MVHILRRATPIGAAAAAILLGVAVLAGCGGQDDAARSAAVVASLRAEPRSFNRYAARDLTSEVISQLTHAALVKIDRVTQEVRPELAESWTLLPDRQSYRLALRRDARFSDGAPFTSADVVFSFQALYDERAATVFAESVTVGGKPLDVVADGPDQVVVHFPAPFGPGLRILDGVPILPKHRLAAALKDGTFHSSWNTSTPAGELAGMGPYRLQRYEPGQRLVFERNPFHWIAAAATAQHAADRLILEVVSDQDAEALRLQAGDLDFTQTGIRPADYPAFRRAQDDGRVVMHDLGVAPDGDLFWINLAPRSDEPRDRWLQHRDFRRAISLAVDREAFADTVYLGAAAAADGIVSPGNVAWHQPRPTPPLNRAAAATLLDGLGLARRANTTVRRTATGAPAGFTLLTQSGNTSLVERGATVIREALAVVGVEVTWLHWRSMRSSPASWKAI